MDFDDDPEIKKGALGGLKLQQQRSEVTDKLSSVIICISCSFAQQPMLSEPRPDRGWRDAEGDSFLGGTDRLSAGTTGKHTRTGAQIAKGYPVCGFSALKMTHCSEG